MLPGSLERFLLVHIPLIALILYGLQEVNSRSHLGKILSIILSLGGFFAFSIHTFFKRKGDERFYTLISNVVLYLVLICSIIQIYIR
jgi:hypothetical protein